MTDHTSALLQKFDTYFRDWVRTACQEWNYPMPSAGYYAEVYERLPEGLRALLALGLSKGLIVPTGRAFTLEGLPSKKGPYNWFSHSSTKKPAPNWEYFVQVAEFVRFHNISTALGLSATFEDHTMDIALYHSGKLVVYYEVKEKASQIQELIEGIKDYGYAVNFTTPDRGNDPLHKAKCIVKRKPEYFSGVAIGARFEYRVVCLKEKNFRLVRDVIPWV